jgi:peroxiredoxin
MTDRRVITSEVPPDFELEDTQGNKVKLSDFKGKKNVYLVFNRGFA